MVRQSRNGRKAEGYYAGPNDNYLPRGELYTEFWEHKREYRIVVFKGAVVGRYYKKMGANRWMDLVVQPKKGFEDMDAAALRAAQGLGIDYVGFDVLSRTKKDFRFLEANSAPMLTAESETAIVEYYLNLEN